MPGAKETVYFALLFVFAIIIINAFTTTAKDTCATDDCKQLIEETGNNAIVGINYIYWGVGIAGSIIFLFLLYSWLTGNARS